MSPEQPNALRGRAMLAALVVTVAVLWLAVLPRMHTWPSVQSRIERHERHGIEPGAMFYTDHEMFDSRRSPRKN